MTDGHDPLAILVPVLKRPHRVAPLVESIMSTTTPPYRVVFVADPDDWPEHRAISDVGWPMVVSMITFAGNYAAKINHAVAETDEPLIALVADDVDFQPGWLEAALKAMTDGVGVVGVNDNRPRDFETATHFLASRDYCRQPAIDGGDGPLFTGYSHNFVDREFIETARSRGVYAYAEDAVIEHLHHLDGRSAYDDTYAKGDQYFRRDARLFRHRSRLWT